MTGLHNCTEKNQSYFIQRKNNEITHPKKPVFSMESNGNFTKAAHYNFFLLTPEYADDAAEKKCEMPPVMS